ncbi:gamma-glutamyltransferase [Bythopirellula polymerisocia]|uniref:Glutathione hydrolase proenzyme n=1 Tax=Bythopirellula polymerisocia TaxID=2528003 RepID=A0A5C6CN40_9BACT|nr:gamma-glutamyltransferase [Bythopirellula polymerisocia]TWU24506.1 Gamma-glutamyltranspeptidase precursor [Bythopirellula polymerisocia]
METRLTLLGLLSLTTLLLNMTSLAADAVDECVVASVNPLATQAGLDAFEQGGNAVDAAIATALTLGVVDNHNSGLGGGCFILIRLPDGSLAAIDGREKAPAAATRDMYVREGVAQPELSTTGPLAVAVPGALAAYSLALEKYGKRTLPELILPAAEIAEKGFAIDRVYSGKLAREAKTLARLSGGKNPLLRQDGNPYSEGEVLRQPDLANSYRQIAEHGLDWFYRGEFAQQVGQWMAEHDGILTAADFATYEPVEREPLVTTYRDWQIIGFPPPSSGGVHVAQILNILENFDLAQEYERDPVRATHIVIEAMKLAFVDRAYWLGDADFVEVPRELIGKDYAKTLAERIDPQKARPVPLHGVPPRAKEKVFGKHTTHISAADSEGYWVAITATVNTTFGSKVIVPGTGIVLNNEMDDFSSQPGVPNAFGLVGAENNAIAPGKRPLSSMSPTIVLDKQGKPILTVGAAGGPKIITQVLQTLLRHLDLQEELPAAVAAPRVHHQWHPDSVLAEAAVPAKIIEGLKQKGHKIESIDSSGVTQAVGLDSKGKLTGVHDPRVPGKAGTVTREQKKQSRN